MKIIIYGFMACGKTTVGKIVSKKLKLPFYDTDLIFEKRHKTNIYSYIKKNGIKKFREEERKIFKRLLKFKKDCVISVGGGIFPSRRKDLIEIFLDTPYNIIKKRFPQARKTRPLLSQQPTSIRKLYLSRLNHYKKAAFIVREKNSSKAAKRIVEIYYEERNKNKE